MAKFIYITDKYQINIDDPVELERSTLSRIACAFFPDCNCIIWLATEDGGGKQKYMFVAIYAA